MEVLRFVATRIEALFVGETLSNQNSSAIALCVRAVILGILYETHIENRLESMAEFLADGSEEQQCGLSELSLRYSIVYTLEMGVLDGLKKVSVLRMKRYEVTSLCIK